VTAEPPFQALGDVLSLRTQTVSIEVGGKTEQRLALFAEIEALDPLVAMNKAGQKLYTSIEISPNFAGTNKAYLVGLPSPTARRAWARKCSPLPPRRGIARRCAGARSTRPTCSRWPRSSSSNWPTRRTPIRPSACWADRGLLRRAGHPAPRRSGPGPRGTARAGASAQPGPDAAAFAAMGKAMTEIAGSVQAFAQASAERSALIEGQVAAIQTALEQTPAMAFAQRQPATGGDGRIRTDC
jgi:hypothetical protein